MMGPRLRGGGLVLASLAVHAVAIVAVSALALRAPVAPLFVDLTQDGAAAMETGAGGGAATSTAGGPASGRAPMRRGAAAPSGSAAHAPRALPAPRLAERSPDTSGEPRVTVPPPPASTGTPAPLAPPPMAEHPAPSPEAAVEGARAPGESGGDATPRAAGMVAAEVASATGTGRTAGVASEVGGAGAGAGVSAPGGARLALALPGDGRGGAPAEYGPYLARFRRSVEDALVYPLAARRQGLAGRVELDVLLDPGGRVTEVEIHTSSSHGVLDEAAIAAVRSLAPMPFPEGLPRRPLRIRLPLDFQLR